MIKKTILNQLLCMFIMSLVLTACGADQEYNAPNIIYILADDLGYGDVSAFNPEAAWKTNHIDRLANEGIMFTDAHTGSAVCTPTRYGVLTGRYSWRTSLKKGVLWSWDKPLIQENEMTVGKLLKQKGYSTACIGKWHLGLGWSFHEGTSDSADFSEPVTGGPVELGFDYFYGITASLDIPPYVYIENDLATMVPTRYTENTSNMGWWRRGLTGDDFDHEQVLHRLTEKTVEYIGNHVASGNENPFFIYFPLPAPHTPIIPTDEFKGKSGTNAYGDFMLQVDWTVGQVLNALDRHGIGNETLVIFTSDNGCSPQAEFEELATFGHDPSFTFRGTKADIFEGGHRVPFVASWPGMIKPGSVNDQVICLTDLLATVAALNETTLAPTDGVDSYNLLPLMLGGDPAEDQVVREATVHHSINGSFAIRQGNWKLIMCPGSGGWSFPRPGSKDEAGLPPYQLFDLSRDIGETRNLIEEFPEVAKELQDLLTEYILTGRSTPGPDQPYVNPELWPGTEWAGIN